MSLVDPQSQKVLLQSMEEFFFGKGHSFLMAGHHPNKPHPAKVNHASTD
jgi:Fe-S cluster biosynthesis and repair protein YggX